MSDSELSDLFDEVDTAGATQVKPNQDDSTKVAGDSEASQKLAVVKNCFLMFEKAIKNIGLYLHNVSMHTEFVEKPLTFIQQFGEQWGPMVISIETTGFLFAKTVVFDASYQSESVAYKFFRDGVRKLVFRPDIDVDELMKFVKVCMANFESPEMIGKDMLSLLWEAEFECIDYVVVEGFHIDDMEDEDVEVQVEDIVNYLYGRLKSNSDDYLRFARLSAEDLTMELTGVDAVRGAIVVGHPCSDELMHEIQEEIRLDTEERMLPKLVNIVFKVIEDAGDEHESALIDVATQLLDAMLLQEDFASISQILTKFKAIQRDPQRGDFFRRLHEKFVRNMAAEERLRKIGEVLNTSVPKDPKAIFRYLLALDSTAVIPLLDILEYIEISENRSIICDGLIAIGAEHADAFAKRLLSDKSQLVRDMMYIIDRIDAPDKMKMFGEALRNPNLAVRLEALGVLARSKTEECRQMISDRLNDENKQMRLQAARLLPAYDQGKAYLDLSKLVKSSEFAKRDLKEKIAVYSALGTTQQPGALASFHQMLTKKGMFKKTAAEEKLLAIAGLTEIASIPSFQLLKLESDNSANTPEVLAAARRGMGKVRLELFGDDAEEEAEA